MFPTPPVMISFVVSLYTPLIKDTVKIIILSCLDMYFFSFHLHQNVNTLLNYATIQKIPLHQPLTVSRTTKLFAPCVLNLIKNVENFNCSSIFFS